MLSFDPPAVAGAFLALRNLGALPGVVGILEGEAERVVAGVKFSLLTGFGSAGILRVDDGALRNNPLPSAPVATVLGAPMYRPSALFMGVPAVSFAILLGFLFNAACDGSSFWRFTGLGFSSLSSSGIRGCCTLTGLGETGISRSDRTAWDLVRLMPFGAISGVRTAFLGVMSDAGTMILGGLGVTRFAA